MADALVDASVSYPVPDGSLFFRDGSRILRAHQGYHRTLGVRPMRKAVERHLQDAAAENRLAGVAVSRLWQQCAVVRTEIN